MVAEGRPGAEITGLDNFSAAYINGHGMAKTLHNFAVAGISDRAAIQEGDMRSLPFDDSSFDAAVSSYAIDHLRPPEIPVALAETARVLRNGGDLLLMVIVPNRWTVVAFGPLIPLIFRPRRYWRSALRQAGLRATTEGSYRGLAWFLARKDSVEAPATAVRFAKAP